MVDGRCTHDIRLGSHTPVFVASFRETLYDIGFIPHESEQSHDLFPTSPDPRDSCQSDVIATDKQTHLRNMSLCSASLRMRTSSSMLSTSYSIPWINGPNVSVMSSIRA